MIKIFGGGGGGGGRGGDTFKPPVSRCFWKDPLIAEFTPQFLTCHFLTQCFDLASINPCFLWVG